MGDEVRGLTLALLDAEGPGKFCVDNGLIWRSNGSGAEGERGRPFNDGIGGTGPFEGGGTGIIYH